MMSRTRRNSDHNPLLPSTSHSADKLSTMTTCGVARLQPHPEALCIMSCWSFIVSLILWTLQEYLSATLFRGSIRTYKWLWLQIRYDSYCDFHRILAFTAGGAPGAPADQEYSCEYGSGKYYALCAFGGLLSCGITHTAVVPLDMVKCRIQVRSADCSW